MMSAAERHAIHLFLKHFWTDLYLRIRNGTHYDNLWRSK